jgi:hypothetical protein
MKKALLVTMIVLVGVGLAMAQVPQTTNLTTDILGAHLVYGRGCVACHAPHSGARGNGGSAATGGGPVTDPNTGNFALWGQDLGPLYNQTLNFGDEGGFAITLPADSVTNESLTTGVMMCLSCHDGNIAKGAMMTNRSWEKDMGLLPAGYGPNPIPTLLGSDGTANGNYQNDHPIGPLASLGALGQTSHFQYVAGGCTSHGATVDCLQPLPSDANYLAFINHYGSFNVTMGSTTYPAGGRVNPLVLPTTNVADAYLVCTTCHTPHSMYTFGGTAGGVKGTYPTYFFLAAPYNPGATPTYNQASSATQFCRQCHFTGAGGANEGSGIMSVTTKF